MNRKRSSQDSEYCRYASYDFSASVSEKCCLGMYLLGIRNIEDLKGKDPDEMYSALTVRKDFYAEPCMQKMLKIAVGMVNKGVVKDD